MQFFHEHFNDLIKSQKRTQENHKRFAHLYDLAWDIVQAWNTHTDNDNPNTFIGIYTHEVTLTIYRGQSDDTKTIHLFIDLINEILPSTHFSCKQTNSSVREFTLTYTEKARWVP